MRNRARYEQEPPENLGDDNVVWIWYALGELVTQERIPHSPVVTPVAFGIASSKTDSIGRMAGSRRDWQQEFSMLKGLRDCVRDGQGQLRVWTMLLAALAACVVSSSAADASVCVGDCRGNGRVAIADLLQGVNIALGRLELEACPAFANTDGAVDIAQLIRATRNALYGCPGVRFVDNSNGTITDLHTGLMWEKKVALGAGRDYGNLNAADNEYLIAGECISGYCQPSEAAGAACMDGAVPYKVPCRAGCDTILGIPQGCYTADFSTSWEWLAQLNASRFAGHSDWRLPTIEEWLTIVDHTRYDPVLARAFNGPECGPECTDVTRAACSCTHRCGTAPGFFATYRSASNNVPFRVAHPEVFSWWVDTCDGSTGHYPPWVGILVEQFVRGVRGRIGSPSPRLVENGDGTVSDKQTGLMWQGPELMGNGVVPPTGEGGTIYTPRFTWAGQCAGDPEMLCQPNSAAAAACTEGVQGEAVGCATCEPHLGVCDTSPFGRGPLETVWERVAQLNAANMAGYGDWRLPTIAELGSIIDFSSLRPAWDPAFGEMHCNSCDDLPPQQIYGFWSATNLADDPPYVWGVLSEDGEITVKSKYSNSQVRLVRNERSD